MTLEEYLGKDLFLQSVLVQRKDEYDWERMLSGAFDVLVLDDFVHQHGFPRRNTSPRIIVIEDMAHNPIMRYPSQAAAAGYRFHRGKIFTVDGRGEVALLEFHRKEQTNAEPPQ